MLKGNRRVSDLGEMGDRAENWEEGRERRLQDVGENKLFFLKLQVIKDFTGYICLHMVDKCVIIQVGIS